MSSSSIDTLSTQNSEAHAERASSSCANSTTSVSRFYRPELDALRLFAFLSVFVCHAPQPIPLDTQTPFPTKIESLAMIARESGTFGVCLFFLLSSFLITNLLLIERETTGTIRVRSFYLRRILRIWPVYFTVLLSGILLGLLIARFRLSHFTILAFLLLAGNWGFRGIVSNLNPAGPLWSVSVEEQFYLLWPAIARQGGRYALLRLSVLILILSCVSIYALSLLGFSRDKDIWPNSLVQFQLFAIGSIVAILMAGRAPNLGFSTRVAIWLSGVSMWMLAVGVFRIHNYGLEPSAARLTLGYEVMALGCFLIFLSFLGLELRFLPRPITYLGKISYGLYAYHFWMIVLAAAIARSSFRARMFNEHSAMIPLFVYVVALSGTVLLAAVSYRVLEAPFLRMKARLAVVQSRAV